MEEVDEVGEVDMGFDLASWMDEEDDGEEDEDNNDLILAKALKASGEPGIQESKIQQPRAPMTPTVKKILAVAGADNVPTTKTAGADKVPTTKTAGVDKVPTTKTAGAVTLTKVSTNPNKVSNSATQPGPKKVGVPVAKAPVVKSDEATTKLTQSSEPAKLMSKPAPGKAPLATQVKTTPLHVEKTTIIQKVTSAQKKPVTKPLESENSPQNVKTAASVKEVKAQPATRARTRSSVAVLGAAKASDAVKSPATSVAQQVKGKASPAVAQQVKGKATPTVAQQEKGKATPTVAQQEKGKATPTVAQQVKGKASPIATLQSNKQLSAATTPSPQLKNTSPQLKATPITNLPVVTKSRSVQQTKPAASVTNPTLTDKPIQTNATGPSTKPVASKNVSVSATNVTVSSTKPVASKSVMVSSTTKTTTVNVFSGKGTSPLTKVQTSAANLVKTMPSSASAVKNVQQTPTFTHKNVLTLPASKSNSSQVHLATSTKSLGVISSGEEAKSITEVSTQATVAMKTPAVSTTAAGRSKPSTVATTCAVPSMTSTKTTTSSCVVINKSPALIPAEVNSCTHISTAKTPQLPMPLKSTATRGGTQALSATVRNTVAPSVATTASTFRPDGVKTTVPTTITVAKSAGQATRITKMPLLATPPSIRAAAPLTTTSRGTMPTAVAMKSTTPAPSVTKSASITVATAGTTSQSSATAVTSKSIPSLDSTSENSDQPTSQKETDQRATSPCLAEIMALDAEKEDIDLGLTMSMEDVSDTEDEVCKKDIVSNKRPASSLLESPPRKQIKTVKSEAVDAKAVSPLKEVDRVIKGSSSISKLNTSLNTNTADCKTETPALEGLMDEKNQELKPGLVQETKPESNITHGPISNKTEPKINQPLSSNKTEASIGRLPTSDNTKASVKPLKRIVRRFHRGSQTLPKANSSKLLQCLIRIPALDNPSPKRKATVSVSANLSSEVKQTPFHVSALPSTVRQNIFEAVSLFNTSQMESRHIKPDASFTHGISIGHVTQADIDKSLFRENIVSKSSYYSFQCNGEDGIMDLCFNNEEAFLAVMTQIRKTKIGPRYLPVTFFKVLSKRDQDRDCPQPFVRATVVFDQNFASSAFLAYAKAQVWNKPKVEETFSVHNMPGGIPLEFLKQILPDAITIDVDDESCKFTEPGRRVLLGINRKTGDHVLKLFSQMYVNRHCLVLSRGRTAAADSLQLQEILKKQIEFDEGNVPGKTLRGRSRNINTKSNLETKGKSLTADDDGAEIVMLVDDVADAGKVLMGRSAAWTGPSTVDQLRRAQRLPAYTGEPDTKSGGHLDSPRQDLSDISDTSDIGEGLEEPHSKPLSVRSGDRSSLPAKNSRAENTSGFQAVSSREVSESRDSKSHGMKDLDMFGRSQQMRDNFKSYEQGEKTGHTSWSEREQERPRPGKSDLRHFLSVSRDAEQARRPGDRQSSSQWGNYGTERTSSDLDPERGPSSKYARYSPETEWLLLNRDKERAKMMGRRSRSRSRSPSPPPVDSRDRFKRLVQEKMRGLEDFVKGGSRRDSAEDERRSRSPRRDRNRDRDDARHDRSVSPLPRLPRGITRKELQTGVERDAGGLSKASSPPAFSGSGRRITLVRQKSVSPAGRKRLGRGCSSLSPIKIDDDDDDEDGRERERRRRRQLDYNARRSEHAHSHRDANVRRRSRPRSVERNVRQGSIKEVPHKEESSNVAPVSALDSDPEDSSSAQREILHEFVKQLLESANITSTELEMDESANFAPSPSRGPADNTAPVSHRLDTAGHGQQQDYSSQEWLRTGSGRDESQAGSSRDPIPPPIPPPVMPPLFTPAAQDSEKISHLESLAKQLAADIQRQQPQEQPSLPQQQQQQQQYQPQVYTQTSKAQTYTHISQAQGYMHTSQPQVYTHISQPQGYTLTSQTYTHTSQAQGFSQHTTPKSDGLLPTPFPNLTQPPPAAAVMTMPAAPPQLMVTSAPPPPIGILSQPTVPLPFFPNMAAPQVRLAQVMGTMAQTTGQNNNNNSVTAGLSDIHLNPEGKFF
ncbi:hypothetical protein ElyMa_005993800 [Elysia marginata]|uniref:Uncharacterized protein n=1 Tax=Elysia marginata TaxID=1093978 RepID=A0AAV4GGN1_9GAST|nr:hypothetical protein ElyMa_005993800 [Elysia marginata]